MSGISLGVLVICADTEAEARRLEPMKPAAADMAMTSTPSLASDTCTNVAIANPTAGSDATRPGFSQFRGYLKGSDERQVDGRIEDYSDPYAGRPGQWDVGAEHYPYPRARWARLPRTIAGWPQCAVPGSRGRISRCARSTSMVESISIHGGPVISS